MFQNTKEGYMKAHTCNTSWTGSGRSTEMSFLSFNEESFWDLEEECLVIVWKEIWEQVHVENLSRLGALGAGLVCFIW